MSIRDKIKNHETLIVATNSRGDVVVSQSEFIELCDLAHEAVHPKDYSISNDYLIRESSLMDAIWGTGPEEEPQTPEEEETPPKEFERGYDRERDEHNRQLAVSFATSVVTSTIAASHGLDSSTPKVEDIAKGIYLFLKGK